MSKFQKKRKRSIEEDSENKCVKISFNFYLNKKSIKCRLGRIYLPIKREINYSVSFPPTPIIIPSKLFINYYNPFLCHNKINFTEN